MDLEKVEKPAQRSSLLPSKDKVVQWLNLNCASTAASKRRECGSPTRAPSGWSLSLSLSRAKRALEEEERKLTQHIQEPPVKVEDDDQDVVLLAELEEGEVPESPPHTKTRAPLRSIGGVSDEECRLKCVVLEQQISALRKANAKLLKRLNDEEAAHLKECSDFEKNIEKLQGRLKIVEKSEKTHVKEIEELKQDKITLFLRLEKSRSEANQTVRGWAEKVELLKAKVENQKKNLSGLESKLAKVGPAVAVEDLDNLATRQRTRLKNQANQLTKLAAALKRESGKSARPTGKEEASYEPKTPRSIVKEETKACETFQSPRSGKCVPLQKPPENSAMSYGDSSESGDVSKLPETVILQVVTKAFPMAVVIMKNYEDVNASLPTLRPTLKAAIAAMPPATRSLCLSQVKSSRPQASTVKQAEPQDPNPKVLDGKSYLETHGNTQTPTTQSCDPAVPRRSPSRGPVVSTVGHAYANSVVEGPEAAAGNSPLLRPASADERATVKKEATACVEPPRRVYGPMLPPVVAQPFRPDGPARCEARPDLQLNMKVEPVVRVMPEYVSGLPMILARESPSAAAEARAAPMPSAAYLPTALPDARSASASLRHMPPSGSWTVPQTVAYPQYLYEGGKYNPPTESVPAAGSVVAAHQDALYGPRLPPPPAAVPIRLPLCPAAVPIDVCRTFSRKRPAQDDGSAQAAIPERTPRIATEIQVMKKRIAQHLQLHGKP